MSDDLNRMKLGAAKVLESLAEGKRVRPAIASVPLAEIVVDGPKGIPERYQWATFEASDLAARVKAGTKAIAAAKRSVRDPRVILVGDAGAGKTSLACAMLHASTARVRRFAGAYWIAKARGEHRLGQGEAPAVDAAISAQVLVLDDLGIEQVKNTAVAEVIYERHAADRQTIVTTWLTVDAAAKLYGDGIARRLYEGSTIIRCG